MEFLTGTPENIWVPLDIESNLRTASGQRMGEGRAEGLHLGRIIHEAKVAAGEATGDVPGDQPSVRVQGGFIWETVVEYLQAGLPVDQAIELAFKRYALSIRTDVVKQLTLVRDNIHGTPDGLDPKVPELLSMKSTRRTLRKARTAADFEANFWTWVMQEAGYCWMAGVDRVRWLVWWQAGDYSRGAGSGPQMLETVARFTQQELKANWDGVLAIAGRMR